MDSGLAGDENKTESGPDEDWFTCRRWRKIMVRWPTKTGYDRLGSWSMAVAHDFFFFFFFFLSLLIQNWTASGSPTGDSAAVDRD